MLVLLLGYEPLFSELDFFLICTILYTEVHIS
jgi:hypothetical protein